MEPLQLKLESAKEYLGEKWVGHPAYQYTPRHSNTPDIYVHARQPYLRSVAFAARADRQSNPAFLRAERTRRAFANL